MALDRLLTSVCLAEHAARLQQTHLLTDDPLFVDEHLDAMVVYRDQRLLSALRQDYLAPLAALPQSTRHRLIETLTSWLMNMGSRKTVADELHVHPRPCATGWLSCGSCSRPRWTTPPPAPHCY